jgi:hypothetical protein
MPAELRGLIPDGEAGRRTLPVELPPGRVVLSDEGNGKPAFWLSDEPAAPGLWARLRAGHYRSGFRPLLLSSGDDGYPWAEGDVRPDRMTSPADHEPRTVLRNWWYGNLDPAPVHPLFGPGELPDADRKAVTAVFGADWPTNPAPTPPHRTDPDQHADTMVDLLLTDYPAMRLGLVAAGSGAQALAAVGWLGPTNHTNDTGEISAVLCDWNSATAPA